MLGEVGDDATVINDDKKAVAQDVHQIRLAKRPDLTAWMQQLRLAQRFVFMGHGTSHTANVTYDQMQTQMENLGLKNAFIGTVG